MKFKKLTAVLLSAAALVSLPFTPALRDDLQNTEVEAATYFDYYYYTTGNPKTTLITYQLDNRSKQAYIYSCTGEESSFSVPTYVNYVSVNYPVIGIRENAFSEYYSLNEVTISSSITIGQHAFQNSNVETVKITGSAGRIDVCERAFEKSALRKFDCSARAIAFQKEAFWQCMSLNTVHFSDNTMMVSLGESLFLKLNNLRNFSIDNENAYVYLAKSTFSQSGINSICLPDTVTHIPEECFYGCIFTSFDLPESVKSIGPKAFQSAMFPSVVKICSGVVSIADDAFADAYGAEAFYIDPSNSWYKTEDGVLYTKDGSKMLAYPREKKDESFTTNARFFPDYVFSNNSYLKHLSLPNYTPYANGGTVIFPRLANLETLDVPSYYSGEQILTFFHNLFPSTKLHMINGRELLYTPSNGKPYILDGYADYFNANFNQFEGNEILNTYVDKLEDYYLNAEILEPGMTDIQKIMHIRKWIMDRVIYDPAVFEDETSRMDGDKVVTDEEKDSRRNHCIGSVLLHQKPVNGRMQGVTVCEGYAQCYTSLLNKAGIEAHTVLADDHAWNLIRLNGQWYHSDICWDDLYIDYAEEYGPHTPFTYCLVPDALINSLEDGHGKKNFWRATYELQKGNDVAVTDNRGMGDVNGDTAFTQEDVTLLRSYIGTTDSRKTVICDLDFDGRVTSADAEILQEYIDNMWKYCATVRIWRYYYYEAH